MAVHPQKRREGNRDKRGVLAQKVPLSIQSSHSAAGPSPHAPHASTEIDRDVGLQLGPLIAA